MERKLRSLLLAFIMLLAMTPNAVSAKTAYDGYVTICIEDYGIRNVKGEGIKYSEPLGMIVDDAKVGFYKGENLAQVTMRLFNERGIASEYSGSPQSGFYLSSIGNFTVGGKRIDSLGEFDCGYMSGWMMTCNNWFVDRGVSEFQASDGDYIKWQYTCQFGADIGADYNNPSAEIIDLRFKENYGTLEPKFDPSIVNYVYNVSSSVKQIRLEAKMKNYHAKLTCKVRGKTYKPMEPIPVSDGMTIELDSAYFQTYTDTQPFDTDRAVILVRIKKDGGGDSDAQTAPAAPAKATPVNPTMTYNGKARKTAVKVTDKKGKAIASSFYTVKYKNNKNVGTAVATVNFKGKYAGAKPLTATFKIVPKGTFLQRLSKGKKQIKVTWKAQKKQVTGYQIQYSTDKKFGVKITKACKAGKTSYTIKKLKSKRIYYVRIRTYKTVGKTKYYSAWSAAKRVKTM